MKLVSSGLALLSLGLIGCQNPIKDPIDSIVQVVTNPQKEIQKGRQQYPIALAQSGGDLTQFPESTKSTNRHSRKERQFSISLGNQANKC